MQRERPLGTTRVTRIWRFFDTANLGRFLVALILAFAFWAWVTNKTDPEISRLIPAVQVSEVNLPPSFDVVGSMPTVEIQLQGPRSQINAMEAGSVRVQIDLAGVTEPGTYTRNVQVQVIGARGIRVTSVTPSKITVQVDRVLSHAPPPVEAA